MNLYNWKTGHAVRHLSFILKWPYEEFVYPEACLFFLLIQVNLVKDILSSFRPLFSYILSHYSYNNRISGSSSHLEYYQILVLASNE